MRNPLRFWLGTLTVFLLALIPSVVPVGESVAPARAATAGSGVCQQTVGDATNVVVSVDGTHCVIEFRAGTTTWTVPGGVTSFRYLLVGGGGGGGANVAGNNRGAGGGGAGGFVTGTKSSGIATSYNISVGAGGAGGTRGATGQGSSGGITEAFGLDAAGGGGGGAAVQNSSVDTNSNGLRGGSGGGGGNYGGSGGGSDSGEGRNGGSSPTDAVVAFSFFGGAGGAGGGGAGGVGASPGSGGVGQYDGGAGGAGQSSDITGTTLFYAGGGGGATNLESVRGVGGSGVGGDGGSETWAASDGSSGRGGGGGGARAVTGDTGGGDGGSGVVIVRYSLTPEAPTTLSVAGGDGEMTVTYTPPAHTGGGTLSLEYTTDGGSNWRDLGETDGTTTVSLESDGTALINGTLYTVKVRAKNAVGGSSFTSSEVTVGTVIPSPVGEVMRFDATHPDSFTVGDASWADLRGGLSAAPAGNASFDSRSKAFAFDGTGDYLSFGNFGIDFSRGLAIHTVVDFGETVDWERVLEFTSGNSQAGNIAFGRFSTTNQLYFEVSSNAGTAYTCVSATGAITAGFHAYSVLVASDGTCTFRKNGANLVATDSSAQLPAVTVRDANYIGAARGAVNPLKGSIQSVVVYNTAQVTPTCAPIESTFTGDGTNGALGVSYEVLQFTTAGECDWTAPAGLVEADYLLVAGGGGGGGHIAGGGGAGEMVLGTKSDVSPGSSYRMTVGLGGVGGNRSYNNVVYNGAPGGDTSAFSLSGSGAITVNGGGGGATLGGTAGGAGGSGGGGSHSNVPGGASSLLASGFGHAGGGGSTLGCAGAVAGGGGGAGGAGEAAETDGSQHAGDGGAGRASTLTGVSVFYAGGGGGGINTGATCVSAGNPGEGGQGGGGAGGPKTVSTANADSRGFDGATNLGAGGGGASGNGLDQTAIRSGGNGGSGIVIVRYTFAPTAPSISSVSSGDGSLSVSFSAPTSTGGIAITDYEYSFDGTTWTSFGSASAGTKTISGLSNGTAYTPRVRAINGNGSGIPVTHGSSVTPRGAQTLTWTATNTSVSLFRGSVTLNPAASGLGSPTITYSVLNAGSTGCAIADSATPTVTYTAVGSCVVRASAAEAGAYLSATADVTVTIYAPDVPRIWTDFGGFWDSSGVSAPKSNRRANVLAFQWRGSIYSTGVSDSTLDANSVSYTAGTWSALRLTQLPQTCPGGFSSPNYFLTRGSADSNEEAYISGDSYRALSGTGCPSGSELAGLLSDGIQGLDISTGVTNIPNTADGLFALNSINPAAIDDGVPDILVTQLFSPSSVDEFYLEDDGVRFTGGVSVSLNGVDPLDTQFVQQLNTISNGLTASGSAVDRDVRVLAFELVDLIGAGDVAANATHLRWSFSGGSDPAFIAVNEASFTRSAQTVSFAALSNRTYGDSTFSVSASATSGLGVSFATLTPSVCSLSGSNVSVLTVGTCSIQASQPGNLQFSAATPVSRSFTVGPKALTLSVSIANKDYDGSSTATVSGTPTLTGLVSGDANYVAVDTAEITAAFANPDAGVGKSVTVTLGDDVLVAGGSGDRSDRYTVTLASTPVATISKISQATLAMTSGSAMVFGQSIPLVATGGSGSGTLSYAQVSGPCTVSGSNVTATGAGSCVVSATRSGDTNYDAVTSSNFTITVSKASQSVNFTSTVPVSAVSGTTYTPSATATSGLTVAFSITTGNGTVCSLSSGVVTFLASGTCVITATQTGDSDYNAATSVTQTIVAGKINQTITFGAISAKDFDDPAFSAGATVSSGRTVTYATTTSSVCSVNSSSGVISIITVGSCTVTASSAGDSSYAAASDVTRTFTISPVVAGKPSITSVSFGNSSVTVAFSAPSFVGGDAVDGYQVVATSSGGAVTKPDCATTSPCTIAGLTNGEAYTLTIAAINAAGIGAASDASPSITPATIPDAVSALATTPGDTQLQVDWTALTNVQLGGASFTRYDVYLRVRGNTWGSPVAVNGTNNLGNQATDSYTFTGLVNGTAYDVKVVAITSVNGSELASNTATALGVPATAPIAPTGLSATALSNTTALASWSAPTDDGGAAITAYSVNLACTFVNSTDTFCELSGLTAGSTITVTVGATNLMGTGSTVAVTITMPGGSSGGSGGSGGSSAASASPNVLTPPTNGPSGNQRRVIVPPQVTRNPGVLQAPVETPGRPFDPALGSRASIGGAPATITQEPNETGGLSIGAGALRFGLNPPGGVTNIGATNSSPPSSSVARVPSGQSTALSGTGLLPGSQLQVWLPGLANAPREIARVPVAPDGSFSGELTFRARQGEAPIPIGTQVLQVAGFDAEGRQTVVDLVVNIAQGAPAPERNMVLDQLPQLVPGESLATSGGMPETVTIQVNPELREIVVSSGQWKFGVVVADGSGNVEGSGSIGTMSFLQNRVVVASGGGFQPDTRVDIWLFSDPTLLGSVLVGADGSFSHEIYIDGRYATVGNHTLQLQGVGEDGFIKAANFGVSVQEPTALTADAATGLLWWLLAFGGLVVAVVLMVLGLRRRAVR